MWICEWRKRTHALTWILFLNIPLMHDAAAREHTQNDTFSDNVHRTQ